MKKRLLYLALALIAAPLLWGQSTVVCTTASPGTVIGSCASGASGFSSPVTTDPVSATGVWTFDNAANTPLVCSDGLQDSTLTAGRVTFAGAAGRLSDDADLTFATDTLTATKVSVKAGSGSGALSVGGVLCKGAPAQATTGTSEQALATCAIPANTLTAAGSMLRIAWNGQTAANGNNKTVYVRIGASGTCPGTCTLIYQSATSGLNNQDAYSFATGAAYKSSTTAVVKGVAQTLSDAGATTASTYGAYMNRNASVAWTSALEVTISALTPTSAGDFTLLSYSVEVVQ